ncbi:diaminobutyrate-2-oxoglutarate transaminase [Afipia massiliensis]|uniref:Diaminobutyrate-2-oxoglutarate transaminase n=1 Tax=Afipia massiliensis TaxID=211460 RepID=A0A840MY43_9BRAD|nr:diaminobutyrate--2-oxoglutarate transaminase [Afipia massiliensis]MBB5052793.1 diaminobutyrate-2-oxoglutarate transaminase [Afipia massiliensis]
MHLDVFARNESEVRYYCRKLPGLLRSANGAIVRDSDGLEFIDFLSACGSLNYGHNHPRLKAAAIEYLAGDGILAGLDFHTEAKLGFVTELREIILEPRGLNYKMQFPGPTGANCVEAAIKLARKATGRFSIAAFTNAFHGVSAGALAATASSFARRAMEPLLNDVVRLPFEGYCDAGIDDLNRFEVMATDPSGGIVPIAAFLVETVQGEGGLNVASVEWLRALSKMARRLGALLIVDDIQAGCGRTGSFFSFERAGIEPDIVCMAKSISGSGLPMSLLLMKPEHDVWDPGEHNGTFRGNALAFITAAAALQFWKEGLMTDVSGIGKILSDWCARMAGEFPKAIKSKGLGMMQGLEFFDPRTAALAAEYSLRHRVMIECCGPRDEVLKVMAPLNIERSLFEEGLARLSAAVREAVVMAEIRLIASQGNQAPLDPYDHGSDAVTRAELAHRVA